MTSIDHSFEPILRGKRILVTGHTGFTGGWACAWLHKIGAEIGGYALPPVTTPSLHQSLGLSEFVDETLGDILDFDLLLARFEAFRPDAVLHLAAQPLVRESYRTPMETFATNAQGTVNVLEACRRTASVKSIVCVTTDKVYSNREWRWPYRENDALGGKDPYSGSKAAAEMAAQSYAASFFSGDAPARLAIARGGNIIGGGDWSADRLIPDFVRAIEQGAPLTLRYPDATRPWQHVLALVEGYLILLAALLGPSRDKTAKAWNFGPSDPQEYSVRSILELMCAHWERPQSLVYEENPLPEARALALDSSLARSELGWRPPWSTTKVVEKTAAWYREFAADRSRARAITERQIDEWRKADR